MVPFFSASASAASSTRPPRAVLMRIAVGFIFLSSFAPIMFLVSGVSGTCRVMMSLSLQDRLEIDQPWLREHVVRQHLHAERLGALADRLAERAIADDAERRAGDVADRMGQEAELARLVPHPVPHVLDVSQQIAAEREDQRDARARARC